MTVIKRMLWAIALMLGFHPQLGAEPMTYDDVAKRYRKTALTSQQIQNAKMQGECLVALKELTFKRKDKFDPVAEWTNYRSIPLLEQYSPCEVLIMLDVASVKLRKEAEVK